MIRRLSIGTVLAAVTGMSSAATAADPVTFAPHRAVYEISLINSSSGSGVSDMSGRMVYELTGSACEGFTQNMRFVTRTVNQEGSETVNDLRTSSWEDLGGKRLRFSSTQYQNDDLSESVQGDAKHGASGAAVDLVKPAKKNMLLPGDVHFPMQHATALIETAKSGKSFFAANIYDGSEKGEKYYSTNAVIGKQFAPGATANLASLQDAARLTGLVSWPIAISFFESGKDNQDTTPIYELSFRYYENGVNSDMKIDYGAFALKGVLKELQFLPSSKCSGQTP